MATNAYGMDFWIGRILRPKGNGDLWRHVVIADMRNGRAKCHNLLIGEPGKMNSRSTWISFKTLVTRWGHCQVANCFCKEARNKSAKEHVAT